MNQKFKQRMMKLKKNPLKMIKKGCIVVTLTLFSVCVVIWMLFGNMDFKVNYNSTVKLIAETKNITTTSYSGSKYAGYVSFKILGYAVVPVVIYAFAHLMDDKNEN